MDNWFLSSALALSKTVVTTELHLLVCLFVRLSIRIVQTITSILMDGLQNNFAQLFSFMSSCTGFIQVGQRSRSCGHDELSLDNLLVLIDSFLKWLNCWTLCHMIHNFNNSMKETFWKHCVKIRNCWLPPYFSFSPNNNLICWLKTLTVGSLKFTCNNLLELWKAFSCW